MTLPFRSMRSLCRLPVAAWSVLFVLLLAGCGTVPARHPVAQAPHAPLPGTVVEPLPAPPGPATPVPATGAPSAAVLLPLSGANAPLGRGMLDAAQMALFDIKGSRLTLLPRDTGGTPEGAATAARETLDQGASMVIGPLTAGEVQAVQPVAAERSVPILAFSTAAGLAGNGTYLFGFLPDEEVRRVVAVAHEKGVQRIAFLGPSTAYGHLIADSLKNAVSEQKIDLGPVIFFDPATPQPLDAIRRLGSAGADGKIQLDGDALMLPMGGAQLKSVTQLLQTNGIDAAHARFLGTGLWDDPTLAGEPTLQGGWYAAPDPSGRADFERRFRSLYGYAPPRLSSLAYDATALAAALSAAPNGADFSTTALLNPNGFLGVDGIFRLREDGRGERGLAVLEFHGTGVTVVSPAPQTFGTT